MIMREMSQIAQIVNALGLLIVGAAVAWTAYQQYRLARYRLSIDLFDKRYDVLMIVLKVHSKISRSSDVSTADEEEIDEAEILARVLFSNEVQDTFRSLKEQFKKHLVAKTHLSTESNPLVRNVHADAHASAFAQIRRKLDRCLNIMQSEIHL